jgi:hypothetical protein
MSEATEIDPVRKWRWWRVEDDVWTNPELDWLDGTLEEMVSEYGGYSEAPMLEYRERQVSIGVYSLDHRYFSAEQLQELADINALDDDSRFDIADHSHWRWLFGDVHPSSHVIFVFYRKGDEVIEAHGIFCRTYKDMLGVLRLLRGAGGNEQ